LSYDKVTPPGSFDVTIYRENTEDVYSGIEWKAGEEQTAELIRTLNEGPLRPLGKTIREGSGLGIKPAGKVIVKDRIADAMFQQLLLRPGEYSVLATMTLNGDYLSDACAAQVGGLGLAPGANIGDEASLFEATHGTAPKYAGQDKVNPSSVILSGVMMFRHMGWGEAADLIERGLGRAIAQKTVTYDLERQMEDAKLVSCSGFGKAIVEAM